MCLGGGGRTGVQSDKGPAAPKSSLTLRKEVKAFSGKLSEV